VASLIFGRTGEPMPAASSAPPIIELTQIPHAAYEAPLFFSNLFLLLPKLARLYFLKNVKPVGGKYFSQDNIVCF
jgi:hypothetical protein